MRMFGFVIGLVLALVDPLVSLFRTAMRATAPRLPALPRVIHFQENQWTRGYGKVVAGGGRVARFIRFLLSPRVVVAAAAIALLLVSGSAHADIGILLAGTVATASNELVEKREQFQTKQKEMTDILELAKDGQVFDMSRKSVLDKLGATDQADAMVKFKARNRELEELGLELQQTEIKTIRDGMGRISESLRTPIGADAIHPNASTERKSFGQLFADSRQYDTYLKSELAGVVTLEVDVSLKTLMETTAGFAPESVRTGRLVEAATRPIQVLDMIPSGPISDPVEKYMEETTRTHASAEKAEGVTYAESTFVWTEKTSDVRKITDSIPVTDEQLEDASQVAGLLDQRLRFGLRQRLDLQVLVGNGTAPNLRGIINVVGIQTQAKGTDSQIVAFLRALTKIRFTGRANPNGAVFHPNDWLDILLTQNANGDFLFGNPFQGPGPQTLFGIPVAQSDALTENTGLAGDFANFCRIGEKRGVIVEAGYTGTQFVEGKKTLRASLRACFTAYRPAAFCTITGI